MSLNRIYSDSDALPASFPIFPLAKALLLPRGQLPLNIFEPRYLAMIDDVMKADRIIGMIQPNPDAALGLFPVGCAGRVTQLAETGDGRYLVTLTGIARFRVVEEIEAATPYRQARADFSSFAVDFSPRAGEDSRRPRRSPAHAAQLRRKQ